MEFNILGKNIEVTDGIREHVEDKLGKLEKYFAPETRVNVTLSVEKDRHKIEVTIPVKGNIIRSEKRPLKNGIDYGFVGDVKQADGSKMAHFIEKGLIPVIAPLTHDGKGNILNTNADTMASEVAKALAQLYDVTLIFSFEKKGVLKNPDDDDSVIPVITRTDFERYKTDGTISGGMLPKIENALAAVEAGVSQVIITLATAIDGKQGTVIK